MDEIKRLFQKNSNLFYPHKEMDDYDYIEWSLVGDNLLQKRQQFREQTDLYKTYNNQNHFVTEFLFEIFDATRTFFQRYSRKISILF